MASTSIVYKVNRAGVDHVLYAPGGPVGTHVTTISQRAVSSARSRVGVKSGKLRGTISLRQRKQAKEFATEISAGGSAAPYAGYHHDGSKAVNGKLMVFQVGGATVFTMKRKAIPANPFLLDALRDVGLQPRRMS